MSNVATFAELEQANDTEYVEVEAFGKTLRLGSLNSADMMEWIEGNETEKKNAGVTLIVKSLVDKDGKRVPKEKFDELVAAFRNKSAKSNTKVITAALKLNGFERDLSKNDSGVGATVALPTGLPSPSAT